MYRNIVILVIETYTRERKQRALRVLGCTTEPYMIHAIPLALVPVEGLVTEGFKRRRHRLPDQNWCWSHQKARSH